MLEWLGAHPWVTLAIISASVAADGWVDAGIGRAEGAQGTNNTPHLDAFSFRRSGDHPRLLSPSQPSGVPFR